MLSQYLLVQYGHKIDLAHVGDCDLIQPGQTLERDPAVHGSSPWKVAKAFSIEEVRILDALRTLIGFERLRSLFRTEVM